MLQMMLHLPVLIMMLHLLIISNLLCATTATVDLAAQQKFLYNNGQQPEVTTLPSGVQYNILKRGAGKFHPKLQAPCVIHYAGKLLDGTIFDSSFERNQPSVFKPSGVIPGWTEVLQRMVVGDEWQVYIPSKMGYGDKGTRGIPGGAMLVFHIQLIDIQAGPEGVVKKKNVDDADGDEVRDDASLTTGRPIPDAPVNRTETVGVICRERSPCSHNGACVANGYGFTLEDHYTFIVHREDTGEDKFLHHIMVDHVDADSVAAANNVKVGDYVEHVNKVRDGSARKTSKRITRMKDKKEMALGLIRKPDRTIRDLDYGGNFNITLVLGPQDTLGLKLGDLPPSVWGVKIRKVSKLGVAHTTVYGKMFLKHDIIRGVNQQSLQTQGTVQDFVQMLQEARANDTTVFIHGHRPLPQKNTKEWNSIRASHFTATLSAKDKQEKSQQNMLGRCECRGTWTGRSCDELMIMAGAYTQTLITSSLNESKYEEILNDLSRVPGGKKYDTHSDKKEDMIVVLDKPFTRSTAHVSMHVHEICSLVVDELANIRSDGTGETVCVYHGLFLSLLNTIQQDHHAPKIWRVGYATSFSPFGQFYDYVESAWVIMSDSVPSIRTLPSSGGDVYSTDDTFVVRTHMNMLHVLKLSDMNVSKSRLDVPTSSSSSSGSSSCGIEGRSGEWDEMLSSTSMMWDKNAGYVLAYVGTSSNGSTAIGIATSKAWDAPFVRVTASTNDDGEFDSDGRIASDTVNVTELHDPFLYMDDEGAYHILFMGTPAVKEEDIAEEAEITKEEGVTTEVEVITEEEGETTKEDKKALLSVEKEDRDEEQEDKKDVTSLCTTAVYHSSAASLTGMWSVPSHPSLECGQYDGATFDIGNTILPTKKTKDATERLTRIRRPTILFSSSSLTKAVAFYVTAIVDVETSKNDNIEIQHHNVILGATTGHTDHY